MDGTVAGIVFGASAGERVRFGNEELTIPPEGLNFAIGIDTALAFTNGPFAFQAVDRQIRGDKAEFAAAPDSEGSHLF
jgi:hypothetical protein